MSRSIENKKTIKDYVILIHYHVENFFINPLTLIEWFITDPLVDAEEALKRRLGVHVNSYLAPLATVLFVFKICATHSHNQAS